MMRKIKGGPGLLLLALAMLIFAGAKGKIYFYLDVMLRNLGCAVEGDTVTVDIGKAASAEAIDLSTSPILIYRRPYGSEDAASAVLLDDAHYLQDYPRAYTVANATNYSYWIYCDYTPPPSVHTNGVWQARMIEVETGASQKTYGMPLSTIKKE